MKVQQIAEERRIEDLDRMEAKILEADLRQEAKIEQENELRKEAEIGLPKDKKIEEG